jgi:hypothetical protein
MSYLPEVLSEYCIDFSKELSVQEFIQYGFYKIADATLKSKERFLKNPEVNPIEYVVVPGLENQYNEYRELIYIIAIDDKVAKIGGTYVGMKGRHQSYNCGTRKARKKGTCSVTNFNVTEAQYAAICNGKKVEWYVFEVPLAESTINVWGEEMTYNAKTYYKYESALCNKYQQITGKFPILSSNSGVE